MAPKEKKTKAQIAMAASSGGRAKKKKWSKGKQQDKLNNSVIFDKTSAERLLKELPKLKFITPSIVSERFRITVSLARQAIKELEAKNVFHRVGSFHHAQFLYSRSEKTSDE